jgi:hypothetical protein
MSKKLCVNAASRRDFLKLAATGGALAVTGAAGPLVEPTRGEPAVEAKSTSRGYHETPHIREYYEKARL